MECVVCRVFFFNDTATTEIYTLFLHDALPISHTSPAHAGDGAEDVTVMSAEDMKDDESQPQLNSTRMNTRLVTHSQLYRYFSTSVHRGTR